MRSKVRGGAETRNREAKTGKNIKTSPPPAPFASARIVWARRASYGVALVSVCCYGVALYVGVDSPIGVAAVVSATALLVGCVWAALRLFRSNAGTPALPRTARSVTPPGTPHGQRAPAGESAADSDSRHVAEDKQRAAVAALTLRDAGEFPRKTAPVPIDASEICYHSRPAALLREVQGRQEPVDRGHLVLTDRRLLFAGASEFSTIAFQDIRALRLAGSRSFALLRSKSADAETFHVEYPREFLAYLGLVCHKAGIDLPRVANA